MRIQRLFTAAVLLTASITIDPAIAQLPVDTIHDPDWVRQPTTSVQVIESRYKTELEAGRALADKIRALRPGDRLFVGSGVYRFQPTLVVTVRGTFKRPIRIEAVPGTRPVLCNTSELHPVVEFTYREPNVASFVALRGFRLEGGSDTVKIRRAAYLLLARNEFRDSGINAIAANTDPVRELRILVNDFRGIGTRLQGRALNAGRRDSNPSVGLTDSFITGNTIRGTTGDGIYIKNRNSFGIVIDRNEIDATNLPSVRIEAGSIGRAPIQILRNVVRNSGDNQIQVEGDNIVVANNAIVGRPGNKAIDCSHRGSNGQWPADIAIENNTVVTENGYGIGLPAWKGLAHQVNNRATNNLVISNRRSQNTYAFWVPAAGMFRGNVAFGNLRGLTQGVSILPIGLGVLRHYPAFSHQPTLADLQPVSGLVVGQGDPQTQRPRDITGRRRIFGADPGCLDADSLAAGDPTP